MRDTFLVQWRQHALVRLMERGITRLEIKSAIQNGEEMTQDYGRCPLCGGEKTAGKATFTVDLKFGVVVIREVPELQDKLWCGSG